jgi:hypothetical protein
MGEMNDEEKKLDQELVADADHGSHGRGAAVEMMRRLKDAILRLDASSAEQQDKVINLTRWMMGLTVVMAIEALVQLLKLLK